MGRKHIALSFILTSAVAAIASSPASYAKKTNNPDPAPPDSSLVTQTGAFQSVGARAIDPIYALLLWQLSHKPELMNLQYLKYYLGNPARQTSQTGAQSQAYYWYDTSQRLTCELSQERDLSGAVVESTFVNHLPPGDFDFDLVEKKLGPPLRRYYDNQADPTEMYAYAPNTTLALTSPHNTFAVTRATVTYIGPPLPQPADADMQVAHDHFVINAQQKMQAKDFNWQDALVAARAHVSEHPNDGEAHAALAQALKKTGNVHDAITEFKYALTLNQYNEPVKQMCIQGLKDLYVLPADYNPGNTTGVAGNPNQFSQ